MVILILVHRVPFRFPLKQGEPYGGVVKLTPTLTLPLNAGGGNSSFFFCAKVNRN